MEPRKPHSVTGPGLLIQPADVALDRGDGNPELQGNLRVAQPVADKQPDIALSGGQSRSRPPPA